MKNPIPAAIEQSISHNEIVTIHADGFGQYEDFCGMLSAAADDEIEQKDGEGFVYEFWGSTDEGDDWRVHVRLAKLRGSS